MSRKQNKNLKRVKLGKLTGSLGDGRYGDVFVDGVVVGTWSPLVQDESLSIAQEWRVYGYEAEFTHGPQDTDLEASVIRLGAIERRLDWTRPYYLANMTESAAGAKRRLREAILEAIEGHEAALAAEEAERRAELAKEAEEEPAADPPVFPCEGVHGRCGVPTDHRCRRCEKPTCAVHGAEADLAQLTRVCHRCRLGALLVPQDPEIYRAFLDAVIENLNEETLKVGDDRLLVEVEADLGNRLVFRLTGLDRPVFLTLDVSTESR